MKNSLFFSIIIITLNCFCSTEAKETNIIEQNINTDSLIITDTLSIESKSLEIFAEETRKDAIKDRTEIVKKLSNKIENNEPLFVHVLVPLCDNENQGIVPTTESLGNGLSLRTNLYWATSHGNKKYFERQSSWKLKHSIKDPSPDILERVVFKKAYPNNAIVYMIADAYRGDRMVQCLNDYFNALAGNKTDTIIINDSIPINLYGNCDMVAFNGHNGLMDEIIEPVGNIDFTKKDAVSISCASSGYFNPYFIKSHSYPLVTTTNLLYPGAFIIEAIIDNWAMLKTDEEIRLSAGDAYHRVKKCGTNGARRLFKTGW